MLEIFMMLVKTAKNKAVGYGQNWLGCFFYGMRQICYTKLIYI